MVDFIKNTQLNNEDYWNKRVSMNINHLLCIGADFSHTRWVFDWDVDLSTGLNMSNILNQFKSLEYLKNRGAIDFIQIKRNEDLHGFSELKNYKINSNQYLEPRDDLALNYFEWIIWITDYDDNKFMEICKELRIPFKKNQVKASFFMDDLIYPSVTIGDATYRFSKLKNGSKPFFVISLLEINSSKPINVNSLKNKSLKEGIKIRSIKTAFAKTPFDNNNGPLNIFLEINHRNIKLFKNKLIDLDQARYLMKKSNRILPK